MADQTALACPRKTHDARLPATSNTYLQARFRMLLAAGQEPERQIEVDQSVRVRCRYEHAPADQPVEELGAVR
jgi:hypothetical protein